jgi:hypothetical protein
MVKKIRDPGKFIPDPGDKKHRIRIRNTGSHIVLDSSVVDPDQNPDP